MTAAGIVLVVLVAALLVLEAIALATKLGLVRTPPRVVDTVLGPPTTDSPAAAARTTHPDLTYHVELVHPAWSPEQVAAEVDAILRLRGGWS